MAVPNTFSPNTRIESAKVNENFEGLADATAWDTIVKNGWISVTATLTYSSADDPTYVVSTSADLSGEIQAGDRIKFTNNSTTFYGIVTAITSNSITIYGGTDYDVANSAITSVYYSHVKSPKGFPMDPLKWSVIVTDTSSRSQASPVASTWYNLGTTAAQISIPIGSWLVYYKVKADVDRAAAGAINVFTTLSTANNTESDADFTYGWSNGNLASVSSNCTVQKHLLLASKTLYYLNTRTTVASMTNIYNANDSAKLILRATCAYL